MLCMHISEFCGKTLEILMDMDVTYDNLSRVDIFIGHLPGGTSTLNIRHW